MRRLAQFLATAGMVSLLAIPAHAVLPSEMLKDPALEARARHLSEQLRCMVCQNQSIDDSDAPLAADIRVLLRQRIAAGDSDRQVIDFLVARYGEFILLKPPVNVDTLLLWLTPPAVLMLGGLAVYLGYRRRREAPPPLDGEEEKALRRLVSGPLDPSSNITES